MILMQFVEIRVDDRGTEEMIIYSELETMVENLVVNYLNITYPYFLGSTEENHKYLCQVKQYLSKDLAVISLEYKSVNCQSLLCCTLWVSRKCSPFYVV